MTRYERKRYFEELVALRDAYREEPHESTGMTIGQAMRYAKQRFDAAVAVDIADAAAIEATLAKRGAPSTAG